MDGFVVVDPRFAAMVLPNAPLELLGEGFRWLEGPVWFADHQVLLFSDRGGRFHISRALAVQQRADARPAGPADHVLAPGPLRHAHRDRWTHHGSGR